MGEKPPLPSFPSESIDGRVKDSSLIDVGRAAEGGGWRLASVPFLVTSIPVTFRVSHVDQSQRCGKCNSLSNVRPADRQAGGRAGGEGGRQASRSLPSPSRPRSTRKTLLPATAQRRDKRRRDENFLGSLEECGFFLLQFSRNEFHGGNDIVPFPRILCTRIRFRIFEFIKLIIEIKI